MNEAQAELLDSDLLRDAEATNQRPALGENQAEGLPDGDELKTMSRLPPVTPPPPPMSPPMTTMVPPPMPMSYRPSAPPGMPQHIGTAQYSNDPFPAGKPSWLRALLTTTFPPPRTMSDPSVRSPITPTTAGTLFAALGLVFAVLALVTGLRATPDDSITPVVAAAIVIARALVTLGSGALSFVLLRSAERLLVDTNPKPQS